jgi:flavin-binding protein dodecin
LEDAAREALTMAASSLRDLRVAEVMAQDVTLGDDGEIESFRTKLASASSTRSRQFFVTADRPWHKR